MSMRRGIADVNGVFRSLSKNKNWNGSVDSLYLLPNKCSNDSPFKYNESNALQKNFYWSETLKLQRNPRHKSYRPLLRTSAFLSPFVAYKCVLIALCCVQVRSYRLCCVQVRSYRPLLRTSAFLSPLLRTSASFFAYKCGLFVFPCQQVRSYRPLLRTCTFSSSFVAYKCVHIVLRCVQVRSYRPWSCASAFLSFFVAYDCVFIVFWCGKCVLCASSSLVLFSYNKQKYGEDLKINGDSMINFWSSTIRNFCDLKKWCSSCQCSNIDV